MKTIFTTIVIAIISFLNTAHSQDSSRVVGTVKLMPLALIDADNSLTIGFEIPLKNQWAIQQEFGWGNNQTNVSESVRRMYVNKNIWRYSTQVRCYVHTFARPNKQLYLAAEYFRKDVFVNKESINTHRAINGLHAKIGYQSVVDNFVFDAFFGLGVRHVAVTNDSPVWIFIMPSELQTFNGTLPSMALGFSIGHQIKKKIKL